MVEEAGQKCSGGEGWGAFDEGVSGLGEKDGV